MIHTETRVAGTFESKLQKLKERLGRKVEAGLKATGEALHLESMGLVPIDTSALLESSHVRMVGSGLNAVAIVGYGIKGEVYTRWSEKENELVTRIPYDYAVYVHEVQFATHDVGQANFLREPLQTKRAEMAQAFNTAALKV